MFLGNRRDKISMIDIKQARLSPSFESICAKMSLKNLIVLDQVHGSSGLLVEDTTFLQPYNLYRHQGDFLVTQLKDCGLVVLTADCVPIILYDKVQQIIGIAHAGWRGCAQGVVIRALQTMQQLGSVKKNIEVTFAASARSCCYEVGFEFPNNFLSYPYASKAFIKRNNTLYFDKKLFLKLQLQEFGIQANNIHNKSTECTICHHDYCSFRRERDQADRQATVVALR